MRLEKYLVKCGLGSRREIKNFVTSGRIKVDGIVVLDEGENIDEINGIITFDDNSIKEKEMKYYIMNKKAGYITAMVDERHQTVTELLPDWVEKQALFPVGRLDKDTEGLLLFTNDGDLNYHMTHPERKFTKKYYADLRNDLSDEDIEKIESGIDIGTHLCLPAKIEKINDRAVYITIHEGKFHQVKRMFRAVNNRVVYLKRVEFGNLNLGTMELGDVIEIQRGDIEI